MKRPWHMRYVKHVGWMVYYQSYFWGTFSKLEAAFKAINQFKGDRQ